MLFEKNRSKKIILILISLLLFWGCSTTIPIKVRKPAELNIGAVRTLAVLDFDFAGHWALASSKADSPGLSFLEKLLIGATKKTEQDALKDASRTAYPGSQISDQLVARLVQNGYYAVIERSELEKVLSEQSLSLSGLVDEGRAAEIGHLVGAQAMITASGSYSVKDVGEWQTYTKTVKDRKGKKKKVKKKRYEYARRVGLQLTFRIIDVESGRIIVSKTNQAANFSSGGSTGSKYKSRGPNPKAAADGLPDWLPIVNGLVGRVLDRTVAQIAPHVVTEKRVVEKGDSDRMKAAVEYCKRDMWEDAFNIWTDVLKNHPSKKDKLAAVYDLGLYYEVFGRLDQADKYYQNSYELSGDNKYLDARAQVRKRKQEQKRLQSQEQSGQLGGDGSK